MPTISIFYGIVIMMRPLSKEHNPPHIHAFYQNYEASYRIKDGIVQQGHLPKTADRLVKEFIDKYRNELLEMWETENYKQLKGIE